MRLDSVLNEQGLNLGTQISRLEVALSQSIPQLQDRVTKIHHQLHIDIAGRDRVVMLDVAIRALDVLLQVQLIAHFVGGLFGYCVKKR